MSLEEIEKQELVNAMKEMYHSGDEIFQQMVHEGMELSKWNLTRLSWTKKLLPSLYERQLGSILSGYGEIVYKQLKAEEQAQSLETVLEEAEETVTDISTTVDEVTQVAQDARGDYVTVRELETKQIREVEETHTSKQKVVADKYSQQKQNILERTDPEHIVRTTLNNSIANSPYVSIGQGGKIIINDDQVIKLVEDRLLEKIVGQIVQRYGTGFMGGVQRAYNAFEFSHWDHMANIGEIGYVNWPASIEEAASMGFSKPTMEHLLVSKFKQPGSVTIDSAFCVDRSGSMDWIKTHDGMTRMKAAKETALAAHSLMRNLNPDNKAYFSAYSDTVRDYTPAEFHRRVRPHGGTRTDLALEQMLEQLKDSQYAMAHLITDGYPDSIEATVRAARKYRTNPNILLRIYLIDGEEKSEKIMRDIAKAAGSQTKLLNIPLNELGREMIYSMGKTISQMQTVSQFTV